MAAEKKLFGTLYSVLTPSVTRNTSFDDHWSLKWNNKLGMQNVYKMVSKFPTVVKPATPSPTGEKKVVTSGPVVETVSVIPGPGGFVRWSDLSSKYVKYYQICVNDKHEISYDSKIRGCFFRVSIKYPMKSSKVASLSDISNSITYDSSGGILTAGCDSFHSGVVGLAVSLLWNSELISPRDAERYYDSFMDKCDIEERDGRSDICDALEVYIGSALED